ncbi:MAG: hypothetical protein M3313_13405 [Actinomycetota bacterium]|nr:hypothetical protein [Actinomycetota bacterium]
MAHPTYGSSLAGWRPAPQSDRSYDPAAPDASDPAGTNYTGSDDPAVDFLPAIANGQSGSATR